jgi:hypothetical protein
VDEQQRCFLSNRFAEVVARQPRMTQLRAVLLAQGGEDIVARYEPDLETLLARGRLMTSPVTYRPMEESSCHGNVSRLWLDKALGITAIATGYGLSDDALWRQHSWAVLEDGLLETTKMRVLYFGVALEGVEADRFAKTNATVA